MSLTTYNGQPNCDVIKMGLLNLDASNAITLKQGYCLCFGNATVDAGITTAATDMRKRLGTCVTKPQTASLMLFAGFVAPSSEGQVIPASGIAWIDVVVPRTKMSYPAWTHANMTLNVTGLKLANDDWGLVADGDATLNYQSVAMSMETVDTSGTAALKYVLVK